MMVGTVQVALATAQTAAPGAPAEQLQLHAVEQLLIEETNARRAQYGLPQLELDEQLMRSARQHGQWMASNRSLQHTRMPVAENIAYGQRSAAEALRSWMNSSGHRANILARGHRRLGVAAYTASNGGIYWCQQFGP